MQFDSRKHAEFFEELREEGYHIFSRSKAAIPGFYPNAIPSTPSIPMEKIRPEQTITARAFFAVGDRKQPTVESGLLSLEVEFIDPETNAIFANILTQLPNRFCIAAGTTIELYIDEVLSVADD
jgi:hypothetical protein